MPTDAQPELPLRIVVRRPPPGIRFAVQRGAGDLLAASHESTDTLVFDLSVRVDGVTSTGQPRLLGPFTQGPPTARFVYVNSGKRAGQADTSCDRRAKIPLTDLTPAMVEQVLSTPGSRLETEFEGTGKDGGATCATVKSIVWRVHGSARR